MNDQNTPGPWLSVRQPGGLWIVVRMNPNHPGGSERFPQRFRTEAAALAAPLGPVCQGRANRGGEWLPWSQISATVYENRLRWPRHGYEVRITKAAGSKP